MSLVRGLTEIGGKAVKKTAPFYSAVDEALANLKRPKGTGAEFLTEVMKTKGVKKAEIADRKLEEAFKAKGKITKEEAQQILKENPPPKLQEREYNEKMVREEEDIKEELAQQMYGRSYDDLSHRERRPIFDESQRIMGEENGPQYGDYKTPGGENYREILLKLPDEKQRWLAKNAQGVERIFNDSEEASRFAGSRGDARAMDSETIDRMRNEYRSSHWKDDPNVLAHMRVQDRTGPNGEKILHVEEIQSDWHQEGRKKGYKTPEVEDRRNELGKLAAPYINKNMPLPPELRREIEALPQLNAVPDAPFKKNWHELAMKRLLNYAADNGYDSIAITPGAEQAKRYDLSKHIADLQYDPHMRTLTAWDHDGKKVISQSGIPEEELPNYIGKEATNNLLAKDLQSIGDTQVKQLFGADLEVGGEGMKGFYDKILPDYLNTFGKPYGAQVGKIPVQTGTEMSRGASGSDMIPTHQPVYLDMHNFPITPEMRESIKQKGLPLYQQIGIPTAGAGAASQMPEEPEYGAGGIVNSAAKMEALAKLKQLSQEMRPRAEAVQNLMKMDENRYLRDVVPNSLTNPEIEAEIARMKARAEASQPEVKKADGGAINYNTDPDMSDGGTIIQGAPFKRGGKVKVTTNRDAMFMELSNKKLKRK